ncbi:aldose 1-epimerase family protein [Oryzifoliimicrobium ureilyticus]|uniref:aldose 1-epimerase family protein n=1 Tax=Oryzifoliimicrobium ureilyticus TaxID=3113724 RepID=UPI0030763344
MSTTTRISNKYLSVEVSELGAEMQSLQTADGRSWLWNGDAAFWTGRSPILFPIVGKAPDNKVSIEGNQYELAQHGFARRSTFVLDESDESMCRFVLSSSDATRSVYPFEFSLAVTHRLDGARLSVEAQVRNLDARPMPFGLGFHPAFLWPLPGAEGHEHRIVLDNGGEPRLAHLADGLLTGDLQASPFQAGRLVLAHSLFDADALIFPQDAGEGLRYEAEGGPQLKFTFQNLPNIALWSKPGNAPFLCVEPWHGTAAEAGKGDAITARPFTNLLAPGETEQFGFTVAIEG